MVKHDIEFIDGENYCRWKDVEMTPENRTKLFGLPVEEIHKEDDKIIIIYGDEDYTKLLVEGNSIQDVICTYLKFISYEDTKYSYDNALDEAHGFSKKHVSRKLNLDQELLDSINEIRLLSSEIKSSINIELAFQYFQDLNNYYG